jgi:hypothetical protein
MAEGLANAVQIAVYSALSSNSELVALLAARINAAGMPAIYDDVTQAGDSGDNSAFPYIVIGGDSVLDMSTDTSSGGDIGVVVDVWSRYDGKREVKRIQAAIYNALHRAELSVPDHQFIGCDFDQEQPVTLDPDGNTYHGVSMFRVLIDGQ